jgi:hypothetical protein
MLFMKCKGKMGYLNGIISKPRLDNYTYDRAIKFNNYVLVIHSMKLEIIQSYLFLCTPKEIWNVTMQTCSKKGNATCL